MNTLLKITSTIGLLLTIVPSILVFSDRINFENNHFLMLIGMVLWFAATPFWLDRKKKKTTLEV